MHIFAKTLKTKRLMLFFWCFIVFIVNLALIQLFPSLKEAFASLTANLPPSLEAWFGNGLIWDSMKGYIGMEIMNQMSLVAMIFAILFSLSIFAKEEQSGLMLTQLAKPISRKSYFWQKYFALVFALVIFVIVFYAGAYAGMLILGDTSLSLLDLWQPAIATFLLCLSLSSIAFSITAATASESLAGFVSAFLGIVGYFLSSMSSTAPVIDTLSRFTPFYYYNTPNVLEQGLDLKNILILLAIIIIPLILSLPIFARRDLKTR
ncbi:MAG: ABC transporter permease [Candidatus Nomurabacteria bacterium]|jgi:ABC-type transport system involved in multi-copper enzyme maturation permease subunit|nr:ABC transporter permease [Candidatus Nomurabacteria bacterium]